MENTTPKNKIVSFMGIIQIAAIFLSIVLSIYFYQRFPASVPIHWNAAGIVSTMFFAVSGSTLGIILAIFCGSFLFMGASDLLPESHHNHPVFATTFMTILGIAVLYGVISIGGL